MRGRGPALPGERAFKAARSGAHTPSSGRGGPTAPAHRDSMNDYLWAELQGDPIRKDWQGSSRSGRWFAAGIGLVALVILLAGVVGWAS